MDIPPLSLKWFARPTSIIQRGYFFVLYSPPLASVIPPAQLGDWYCFIQIKFKILLLSINVYNSVKINGRYYYFHPLIFCMQIYISCKREKIIQVIPYSSEYILSRLLLCLFAGYAHTFPYIYHAVFSARPSTAYRLELFLVGCVHKIRTAHMSWSCRKKWKNI